MVPDPERSAGAPVWPQETLCPICDASGLFPAFPSAALTSSCLVPSFNSMSIYAPLDCRFRINAGSLLTRSLPRAEAVFD